MKKIYAFLILCFFGLNIKAQCPITITGNTTICSGQNTTLAATSTATSYTWMPGGITSSTVSVNPSVTTTYTVFGTDGICSDNAVITVTVNPLPTISVGGNPNICLGQATNLYASGATTYSWSPAIGLSSTSGANVTSNPTATISYTVCGTSAPGCSNCNSIMVFVDPPPVVNINTSNASCGICNGTATATASGGSAPYTFNWSTGNTTQQANGLCAGGYTCTITDMIGCSNTSTIVIGSNIISNLYTTIVPAACGQNDGSIIVDSIPGGTPTYTYSLNGGASTTNNNFTNLPAGAYSLTVQDGAGCSGTVGVIVNNSNFSVQLTPVMPGCGACNGSISSSIIGGTAPYTYSWSNGANTSSINGLCIGSYNLAVTDSGGCYTSVSANLIPPNAPVIQIDSLIPVNCNGITSGSATISVSGGTSPYTYLWNTVPTQTTNIVTGLQPGMYAVTVTDNTGCSSSQNIYISNSNNIYVYPTSVNPTNCGTTGSATVNGWGGLPPYTFNWSNGAVGQTATNLTTGMYTVTGTDANGCNGTGYVNIYSQCFSLIKGRVYDDANQNCIQDAGELGLQGKVVIASPSYYYGYTDINGDYAIQTTSLTNTVTVSNYYSSYYSPTCPSTGSLIANFSTGGDTSYNNDFGYYANPNYFDLSIHPGWTSSHPGFPKNYWILFANNSPTTQNVLIRFTYDPALLYDSCNSGGVHFSAQHKIEWTFNNVPANTWWNWISNPRAYFTVPASLPITANLNSYFEILPISGDAYPSDNTVSSSEPITGSRDPNEKTVFPKGTGPTGNILKSDSVLFYTIHFQNNGNDTAFRVVVVDTLSPFLDPATVIPGAANHAYNFDISGQGILTWTFDHIMLPDSLTNEPESNGYLNFTVRQKPNNAFGSVIKNTADIYFDYNSAVVTNTTINTISAPLSAAEYFSNNNNLLLYPNPTSNNFTLQYNLKNESKVVIEIRNLLGEIVKTISQNNKQKGIHVEEINTTNFANGIYLVKLICEGTQQTQKLIIQK